MKRIYAIAAVVDVAILALVFNSIIKDFLWEHEWWRSTLASLPVIALPILAYLDGRTSVEANKLSAEANSLRREANILRQRVAQLEAERNEHLQQIAENTRRPMTQGERIASILRRHLGERVRVSEEHGNWGDPATQRMNLAPHFRAIASPRRSS